LFPKTTLSFQGFWLFVLIGYGGCLIEKKNVRLYERIRGRRKTGWGRGKKRMRVVRLEFGIF
jgi:hypothetical protein